MCTHKKKAQKHMRRSKSRGQDTTGNAMAAEEPAKSRVDSFGQLACLCSSQLYKSRCGVGVKLQK
jgi:hypothetical protein